ncbi:MAG TPA: site-specific integrase [Chitinophagaceae bacterium]|nr:site-specific integrase [Chitinophagaceae bacterium]
MANNNLSILFWLYKSRKNKSDESPIYLRITFDGNRKNISTGFNISNERWDNKKGLVRGNKTDAIQINAYISQTKTKLMELFNQLLKEGDINLDVLIDRFFGRDINTVTLLELVSFHNKDFEARIGTDYTFSTFEKYDILRRKLEVFIPYQYKKKDVRLKDLGHKFMADFDFYLKNHDKNEHNTTTKYLKNLKKILNVGVVNGWIDKNPFENFVATYKDVDRIYLTQKELTLIEEKQFKLERLRIVKDLFLFQCYTGLAYSDMAKLTAGHISPGIDGNKWIITRRQKTDVRAAIPLLPKAEELIGKYDDGSNDSSRPLMPFYAIQKFNSYLHEIADICGINKNLTSHVGRRTFATTIALANGISLETISKILGHTSTKITSQYAVVTDHKVSEEMAQLKEALQRRK